VPALDIDLSYTDFCHPGAAAPYDLFAGFFGPVMRVCAALDDEQRAAFRDEWLAPTRPHNTILKRPCRAARGSGMTDPGNGSSVPGMFKWLFGRLERIVDWAARRQVRRQDDLRHRDH